MSFLAYKKSHAINDFVFNQEIMELLAEAWLVYDHEAEGFMSVDDYYKFVVNLPSPLRLTEDQLIRRLGKYPWEFKGSS